jgi:hypothetical protein
VIGIGSGYLLFRFLDHRAIAIVMAVITLIFVGLWLVAGAEMTTRPRSTPKAITAGLASGEVPVVHHRFATSCANQGCLHSGHLRGISPDRNKARPLRALFERRVNRNEREARPLIVSPSTIATGTPNQPARCLGMMRWIDVMMRCAIACVLARAIVTQAQQCSARRVVSPATVGAKNKRWARAPVSAPTPRASVSLLPTMVEEQGTPRDSARWFA